MSDRLTKLKAMLRARENQPGFEENVKAIREEIARLEKEQADG